MNPLSAARKPFYRLGERVRICIPGYSITLGEFTVMDVEQEVQTGIYVYKLSDGRVHADGTPVLWKEPALKKVYDLSEFVSFEAMMKYYGGIKHV